MEAQGQPVPMPDNLDARFKSEALMKSLTAALNETFPGAQVTSIDCSEYPCIAYGEGMGKREDFDKLKGAAAYAPYRDDRAAQYGWGTTEDGKPLQRFGMVVSPKDAPSPSTQDMGKRLNYRIQQMTSTFTH